MKEYRYNTPNGLTPDTENITRLNHLFERDTGKAEIRLIPTGEGKWKVQGYEFDIEMPTAPWNIGTLTLRDGEYQFCACQDKDDETYKPRIDAHYRKHLDIFYGRIKDAAISQELLFTGKHEECRGCHAEPGTSPMPFGDPENPSLEEIAAHVTSVITHSATVERYLREFDVRVNDGQHPHDLVGPGNKLEWEVIQGLALRERDTPERQRRYEQAIRLHRQGQSHHHMWNSWHPMATENDLQYGAIDAVVSLREPRDYQGGVRTWEEIERIARQEEYHKREWMHWAARLIREIEQKP